MAGGGKSRSASTGTRQPSFAGGSVGSFNPEQFNKTLGSDISVLYGQGPAPIWQGSMYTGLGDATRQGMTGLLNVANSNQGYMDNAMGYASGLIGSGGLTGGMAGNVGTLNSVGNAYGSIANSLRNPSAAETAYSGLLSGMGGPSLTEQQLMNVATGGAFGNEAPGYATMRQNIADTALTGVNSAFANTGRYGAGTHVGAASEGIASALAPLDYQNYQNDIARQERALGLIEQMRQQGFTNQFNTIGAADQARLNQLNARMGALGAQGNAAQSAFGMGQQGVSNAMGAAAALPGMFQSALLPSQTVLGVGALQDADAQARVQAERERFERMNDPGFQHIAKYLGLLQQQSAGPQPEKQPGLLDWVGTLGSLGVGLLVSDRDAKTDIKRVGTLDNGLPVYTFRYKDDPEQVVRIGLMAQDVQEVHPEAVARGPHDYLMVDYGKATA